MIVSANRGENQQRPDGLFLVLSAGRKNDSENDSRK
jgi:hypothetical protein